MAATNDGRRVVGLDELVPDGWIAEIGGVQFPIPGDLPMGLWIETQKAYQEAQRVSSPGSDAEPDEVIAALRGVYGMVVRIIQIETPHAVPEEFPPLDLGPDEVEEWEANYPRGAVVIPDMTPSQIAAFGDALGNRMDVSGDDAGPPKKARPRRASTTKNSRSGSGGGPRPPARRSSKAR